MSHCDPRNENNVTVYNNNERCLENISDDNASSCVRKVIWKKTKNKTKHQTTVWCLKDKRKNL